MISDLFSDKRYEFLDKEPLKGNIILLGLGGSWAYGTNTEDSDLDIRGIATHSADEILTGRGFEQVIDRATDTVVYSLDKMIFLLSNCNPNTIEILGLEDWQYYYKNDVGQALINNKEMFLSKRAINSFGGYANQQLRRLDNKAARLVNQAQQETHIFNSIKNVEYTFPDKYFEYPDDSIKLYIDDAVNPEFDKEIFMDVNLRHYPLRDYKSMWSEMNNVVKDYSTLGKRNKSAIEHNKIAKHMMHLVRLYLMCFDILEKGEINTYRAKDHDFLMQIRNGKYLDDNRQPLPEFFDIVDELENKLEYWKEHTCLPDNPDYDKINRFLRDVNCDIVLNTVT